MTVLIVALLLGFIFHLSLLHGNIKSEYPTIGTSLLSFLLFISCKMWNMDLQSFLYEPLLTQFFFTFVLLLYTLWIPGLLFIAYFWLKSKRMIDIGEVNKQYLLSLFALPLDMTVNWIYIGGCLLGLIIVFILVRVYNNLNNKNKVNYELELNLEDYKYVLNRGDFKYLIPHFTFAWLNLKIVPGNYFEVCGYIPCTVSPDVLMKATGKIQDEYTKFLIDKYHDSLYNKIFIFHKQNYEMYMLYFVNDDCYICHLDFIKSLKN